MRGTTEVYLGIKCVGKPHDNQEPKQVTVKEAARIICTALARNELAKSMNFYITRTYEDTRALMSRGEKSALEELVTQDEIDFDNLFKDD